MQSDLIAPLRGLRGAARESGVAGEEKGLATQVAAITPCDVRTARHHKICFATTCLDASAHAIFAPLRGLGGGGLPAKAEWLGRRKGWPRKWRRLSFPGSLLPTRPETTRPDPSWHDTTRTNSFCTCRLPAGGGGGGGCPRKRSGWRGERAGHTSGGAFPFRAAHPGNRFSLCVQKQVLTNLALCDFHSVYRTGVNKSGAL